MAFDLIKQKNNLFLIEVGRNLLPKEKNISVLMRHAARVLDIEAMSMNSKKAAHLPTPEETGPFFNCPECKKGKMVIRALCKGCKEAENGKYHTQRKCVECDFKENSKKHLVEWYRFYEYDWLGGFKKGLGIKTITDEGLK